MRRYFSSVILAFPISWLVVWYKMYFTDEITPEMRRFPAYKFAIMGLFDTLFNVASTFPVQHLGGDLSNVLSQAVLPINMAASAFFLRVRFKKVHYWGAILVAYGIMVKLSPSIGQAGFSGSLAWIMMMVISQTPSAASNVYKEIGLKACDLEVWYANAWIGVYQLIWGILSVWTVFIPAFVAPHPPVTPSTLFSYIAEAHDCFLGRDVVIVDNSTSFVSDCVSNGNTYADGACTVNCDQDGTPLQVFVIYICFNLTYNVLALYVFKRGSSVLFVVANAARLPLVDALNSWGFVSGQADEAFGKYDALALFVLVMALVIYYSEAEDTRVSVDRDTGDADYTNITVSPRVPSGFRYRMTSQARPGRSYSLDVESLRKAAGMPPLKPGEDTRR